MWEMFNLQWLLDINLQKNNSEYDLFLVIDFIKKSHKFSTTDPTFPEVIDNRGNMFFVLVICAFYEVF